MYYIWFIFCSFVLPVALFLYCSDVSIKYDYATDTTSIQMKKIMNGYYAIIFYWIFAYFIMYRSILS